MSETSWLCKKCCNQQRLFANDSLLKIDRSKMTLIQRMNTKNKDYIYSSTDFCLKKHYKSYLSWFTLLEVSVIRTNSHLPSKTDIWIISKFWNSCFFYYTVTFHCLVNPCLFWYFKYTGYCWETDNENKFEYLKTLNISIVWVFVRSSEYEPCLEHNKFQMNSSQKLTIKTNLNIQKL